MPPELATNSLLLFVLNNLVRFFSKSRMLAVMTMWPQGSYDNNRLYQSLEAQQHSGCSLHPLIETRISLNPSFYGAEEVPVICGVLYTPNVTHLHQLSQGHLHETDLQF